MKLEDIEAGMTFYYANVAQEVRENNIKRAIIYFVNCDRHIRSLQMTYTAFRQLCDEKLILYKLDKNIWLDLEKRLNDV